jgi:hypothetical protein
MTPKEKAIELVNDMTFRCRECDNEMKAKFCAIRAVEEILDATKIYSKRKDQEPMYSIYWEMVKIEIENL